MPRDVCTERAGWLAPVLGLVVSVTLLRIGLVAASELDLFVDEAQYWLWSRTPDWGYFSKPPLIAWVIGLSTRLGGSDTAFWIRLPGPLLHGATALLLAALAARLWGRAAAIWTAAHYLALPMVAAGSLIISTDTAMAPFLAAALLGWERALSTRRTGPAALAGLALGLAALAKYIALVYLLCAAVAALSPRWRPTPRQLVAALLPVIACLAPNVAWNLENGLATITHTGENIGWVRTGVRLNLSGVALFLAAQAALFGPLLLPAWAVATFGERRPQGRFLTAFSAPILALICAEALLARAYANWAASAWLAGVVLAAGWLVARPRWQRAALALNLALTLLLTLAALRPEAVPGPGDRPLLYRLMGRTALSEQLIARARAAGAAGIVSDSRDILADLHHTGRDSGLVFRAVPPDGAPRNHYQMRFALSPAAPGPLLYAGRTPPPCNARPLGALNVTRGAFRGTRLRLWLVPADCWENDDERR